VSDRDGQTLGVGGLKNLIASRFAEPYNLFTKPPSSLRKSTEAAALFDPWKKYHDLFLPAVELF
jgi:hypothetical protein